MAANEGHDGSTVLEPDSYKLQSLHGPKASAELPIISTYNESDVKVFVKVTDSDVRTIMVNIESDTVAEMKQKVTIRQLFQTELTQGMRIRLIYKGKIMLDGHKLAIFSEFLAQSCKIKQFCTPLCQKPWSGARETAELSRIRSGDWTN